MSAAIGVARRPKMAMRTSRPRRTLRIDEFFLRFLLDLPGRNKRVPVPVHVPDTPIPPSVPHSSCNSGARTPWPQWRSTWSMRRGLQPSGTTSPSIRTDALRRNYKTAPVAQPPSKQNRRCPAKSRPPTNLPSPNRASHDDGRCLTECAYRRHGADPSPPLPLPPRAPRNPAMARAPWSPSSTTTARA